VLTDLKVGAAFPSAHPLNSAVPGTFLTPSGAALAREADLVLALDWVDLGGTLRQAYGTDLVIGHGPISDTATLESTLAAAVAEARDGSAVLVDVHTSTRGYPGGPAPKA
jgi:hypothetical protein